MAPGWHCWDGAAAGITGRVLTGMAPAWSTGTGFPGTALRSPFGTVALGWPRWDGGSSTALGWSRWDGGTGTALG